MPAPTDFLIAALATGSNPDDWSVVETLLSSVSNDITSDRSLEWTHADASSYIELQSGKTAGLGFPVVTWKFRGLRLEQRENLRDFCPGFSADVYIRTPTNETIAGVRQWADYQCIAHWAQRSEIISDGIGLAEEVELRFTHCVQVGT